MSELRKRKLKLWVGSEVFVFQDGTTADADATSRFDNAFDVGAAPSGSTDRSDREQVRLGTLTNSLDSGSQLAFSIIGLQAWHNGLANALRVQPNAKVEFFAETPDQATINSPAWHLNEETPSTQVRWFYGFVASVSVKPDAGLEVTCKGPEWRANDVILTRDAANGIDIPIIAFNLPRDHGDWRWGIKITDTTGPVVGTGESLEADSRATLAEILQYISDEYGSTLAAADVLDGTSDIFDATELTQFDGIKPGPIVMERQGIYAAVRGLLEAWAPDVRIVIDPRSTKWRMVSRRTVLGEHQVTSSQLLRALALPYKARVSVPDASRFTATAGLDGHRFRIYERDDPSLNEELTVYSIVGSELRTVETPIREYNADSLIAPISASAASNLILDAAASVKGSLSIDLDLDGVYTAVDIQSRSTTTQTYSVPWNSTDLATGFLRKGWDTAFEQYWRDSDKDREEDIGKTASGMRVHHRDEVSAQCRLFISFAESKWDDDHKADEWNDCVVWIWKAGGAEVRQSHFEVVILDTAIVADVGDGTPGIRLTLDTTQAGWDSYGFVEIVDGGSDRVVITQDKRAAVGNNKRWEVGRKWYVEDTSISFDDTTSPHYATCAPLKIFADNGTGGARRDLGMTPNLGYPLANTRPVNGWETLATGGLGAFHVWRRATYTREPAGRPCGFGPGWQPPKIVQVEFERATTTVRQARYPVSGFQGEAYLRYGLERVLSLPAQKWDNDEQTADYTALARSLWEAVNHSHHRGAATFPGIREHGAFIDLATRVSFTYSGVNDTSKAASVHGFWGFLTECSIDFQAGTVAYSFDDASTFAEIGLRLFEDQVLGKTAAQADLEARIRKIDEATKCMFGSNVAASPQQLCSDNVWSNGRPITPGIKVSGKDDQANGFMETGINGPSGGGGSSTHGFRASQTVIRDVNGGYWGVGDSIAPGNVSGSDFTEASAWRGNPVGIPQRLQTESEAYLRFLGIYDQAHETNGWIKARIGSGSTTTVIQIASPYMPTDSAGGQIAFIFDPAGGRPPYAVASIASTSVTLTSAMSEAAPTEGMVCWIAPKPKPIPSTSDFPSASGAAVGFKDSGGQWYVVQNGEVWSANESGGVLTKNTSGTVDLTLPIGFTPGDSHTTVTLDFSGATVSGLSGSGGADLDDVMGIIDFGF